jgi:alkylation response protein AidB-like acyl-CoA dehydrogenase
MRFEPDETLATVAGLAGEVLAGAGTDLPERTWKDLAQAGLLSLAVPVRLGGAGLGVLATGAVLTEAGRRAATVPALATLALGVLPVVRRGSPEEQDRLLAGLATEGTVLTAALSEPSEPMPARPATTVTAGLAVSGTKIGVAFAEQAHRILVPVRVLDGPGAGRAAVAVVDPAGPGVQLVATPSSGGIPEWTVRFDGATAESLLGGGPDERSVADLYRCAVAGACAFGDGLLAGALALTTAHIGAREQFGRPLAAFQAVAQQAADVYVAARTVHLTTLSALWRLDAGRDAGLDLDVAASWLADQAPAALRTCHHLHGGLGLDATYPLHRYSGLVRDLVRLLGGAEHRLDRLGSRDAHRPD